jgi:hypothetical protein
VRAPGAVQRGNGDGTWYVVFDDGGKDLRVPRAAIRGEEDGDDDHGHRVGGHSAHCPHHV